MTYIVKVDRQAKIINYLKNAPLPIKTLRLANKYKVSEKTIERDIKELSKKRGAPWLIHGKEIILDQHKKNTVKLENYWLEKSEVESLFTLNQIIQQLIPGTLSQQLEPFKNIIEKLLTPNNQQHSIGEKVKLIEISDRKVSISVFQQITQALWENQKLEIEFWNRHRNETTTRTISPQKLIRYKDNWKLDAYCHLRKELRSFSLEAIKKTTIQTEKAKEISEDQLQEHFQSSYGIFAGTADKIAIIKFSEYISKWVQSENWHPEQLGYFKQQNYHLEIPYKHDQELIQDILKHGEHAHVIQPNELKQKIKTIIKAMTKNYQ